MCSALADKVVTEASRIRPFRDVGDWWVQAWHFVTPVEKGSYSPPVVVWAPHAIQPTQEEIDYVLAMEVNAKLGLSRSMLEAAFDCEIDSVLCELHGMAGAAAVVTLFPRIILDANCLMGTSCTLVADGGEGTEVQTKYPNGSALVELMEYVRSVQVSIGAFDDHGSVLKHPFLLLVIQGMADHDGEEEVTIGTCDGRSADRKVAETIATHLDQEGISSAFERSAKRDLPGNEVLTWLRQELGGEKMQAVQLEVAKCLRADKEARDRLTAGLAAAIAAFAQRSV